MNFQPDSDLHKRRKNRNWMTLLSLVVLMVVVVTLSLVKLVNTGPTEGWDHAVQPSRTVNDQ